MSNCERPVIAGAGPVGLGAALFLAMQGRATRLIEMRGEPSRQSKALAVNPRTLDILAPSGLTAKILELGKPVHGALFHRRGEVVSSFSFAGIHPRYPFLIALSQASTERLLENALAAAGGNIERGVRLAACRNTLDGVEVTLEREPGGAREVVKCPWLLAADGAHSTAREQMKINFPGSSLADQWCLADVPLKTKLADDHAHIFFEADGFQFLIRVVDENFDNRPGGPIWRIMANRPDALGRLAEAEQSGPPLWTSGFRISHRINAAMAKGNVYFAGDAAHIHSPIGARGMNLGLEDAWVFAQLARTGQLRKYNRLRRPVDQQVVRRVELLTRVASGESWLYRLLRLFMFSFAIRLPVLRTGMTTTATGLDHKLPSCLVDGSREHESS